MATPQMMKQVSDQCRLVAHLATAIAEVHAQQAKMFSAGGIGPEEIAEGVGRRTAELMNDLGDVLNGMDAVTDEDEWTDPIFAAAKVMFPTA